MIGSIVERTIITRLVATEARHHWSVARIPARSQEFKSIDAA